jgi:hypothetical protein
VVRDEYTLQAAAALDLSPAQMRQVMRGQPVATQAPASAPAAKGRALTADRRFALTLLGMLAAHPRLAPLCGQQGVASYVDDPVLRELLRQAVRIQNETGRVDVAELLDNVPEADRDLVARYLMADDYAGDEVDASRAFAETVERFRLARLERELADLAQAIKDAEAQGDENARKELILRRYRLSQEKDDLVKAVTRGGVPQGPVATY